MLERLPLTGDPPEQLTKQKCWQEHLAKEKEKTEKQFCIKEVKVRGSFGHTGAGRGIGKGATTKTSAPIQGVKTIPGVARLPSETQRHI
ncbi:hypothetical protein PDJAM_G00189820 [Pangasius djambal]|uniref:Uncharacterized protein n=1 Tax=Pangasius djambal TaxID=1691987 RepID=A0ACC5Y5B0_9TELE|nr:hypothetical protein [Pangasius djambal]